MQTKTKLKIIAGIGYSLSTIAIALWLFVMLFLAQSPAPFIEQAPYYILSTLVIFGLLFSMLKGLYYWHLRRKKD